MVTYTCDTCLKSFTQKGHYNSHKARKRPCVRGGGLEALVAQTVREVLATVAPEVAAAATATATATAAAISVSEVVPERPFLKWVGGKTQIIGDVLGLFPTEMVNYHEPFVGGGSVLLALLSARRSGAIKVTGTVNASDVNPTLIGLYKHVQERPDALVAEVERLVAERAACGSNGADGPFSRTPATLQEALLNPESHYYWVRAAFNAMSAEERLTVKGSATFLFLNKTCFRGVYREGPRGFNVPYGHYKNPSVIDGAHVRAVSALLQGVVFVCRPFGEALRGATAGDFAYLDPPYAPEQDTSFVGYTSDGFDLDAHRALFKACDELKGRDIRMLMSNADVALVREAFPSSRYATRVVSCRRAIHSKEPDARTNEVLITN